nr:MULTISPECIES: helix-turn-helix transcriptional regulator [Streptomyces]
MPAPSRVREPLWRHVVGEVLRRERLARGRTLKDVAEDARISMPYLSEVERGRKEASSEVLAAAAQALGLRLADLLALAHARLAPDAPDAPAPERAVVDAPLTEAPLTEAPAPAEQPADLPAAAPAAEEPADGRATSLLDLRRRAAGTAPPLGGGAVLLAA